MYVTQEAAMAKNKAKEKLQMEMKELSDQREYFHSSINDVSSKIENVKGFLEK